MSEARKFRVAVMDYRQRYLRELYRPLKERIDIVDWEPDEQPDPEWLARQLPSLDVVHVHWPDNMIGLDQEPHREVIRQLRESGTPIVWTRHDAESHRNPDGRALAVFQLWADVADGVIHHSEWSMKEMNRLLRFNPQAEQRIIAFPHWGKLAKSGGDVSRAEAEERLGLPPCDIRIGVFASPRPAKDVQLVLDAFAACKRTDLGLFVTCLASETVPDDPRIVAIPYDYTSREVYNVRLRTMDVAVMPFRSDSSSLTTGMVGDVVAMGKASLVSDWPFLSEVLGDSALIYGNSREDLTRCLEDLDKSWVEQASAAAWGLRERYSVKGIAEQNLAMLQEIAATRGRKTANEA